MLRREGSDQFLSAKFYRVVVQAVLLFGAETWVLSAVMLKIIEGVYVGFLQQVTGMKAQRLRYKTWTKEGPDRVLQAAGTKPLWEYIDKRQATVAYWVDLRPIFEDFVKETVYEVWGKLRKPWWQKVAEEQQLESTLKNISAAAGERRQRESDRRGGGEGGD